MKILFAATPAAGHLNPLLAIAHMVLARGDEALVATAAYLRTSVDASGARFLPLVPGADIDFIRIEEALPERASHPDSSPGPQPSPGLGELGDAGLRREIFSALTGARILISIW